MCSFSVPSFQAFATRRRQERLLGAVLCTGRPQYNVQRSRSRTAHSIKPWRVGLVVHTCILREMQWQALSGKRSDVQLSGEHISGYWVFCLSRYDTQGHFLATTKRSPPFRKQRLLNHCLTYAT